MCAFMSLADVLVRWISLKNVDTRDKAPTFFCEFLTIPNLVSSEIAPLKHLICYLNYQKAHI